MHNLLGGLVGFLAMMQTQQTLASPLPQATSVTSMPSGAAPTDGATIVSGFVPSPGGPPNETLYVVTASDHTYLVGEATVTATAEDGTVTSAVEKDVFVLTNGTIDYYGFNETNGIVEAVQCTVNGTIANCNGTIIDTSQGGLDIEKQNGVTFSGASSGVTAYLPTGTADVAGVSFASAAPSLVASATSYLTSVLSSVSSQVSSQVSSANAQANSQISSANAQASSELSAGLAEATAGIDAGGFSFPTDGGALFTGRA